MATVITFDNLSPGDVVGTQFKDDYGITFTSPLPTVGQDPKSPFSNEIAAARAGGPVEFPTWSIRGTLSSRIHSRFGISVNDNVTITFRDEHNAVIADFRAMAPRFPWDGSYFYAEYATGRADIASFDIHWQADHPFSIASITFDTAGAFHKPDFRLLFSSEAIPTKVGATGSISVTVARLYGSTGAIDLEVSSVPPNLFLSGVTTTSVSDGGKATSTLVAKAIPQTNDIITVTGTPKVASAGTVKRLMNFAYTAPLQLPLPLAAVGATALATPPTASETHPKDGYTCSME